MGRNEYTSCVQPVLHWLNSLPGCKAINIHGNVYMERGTPDIIGCYRGRMFAMEAKSDTGQPRPDQILRINQWWAAGAITGVIRSLDDAKRLIAGVQEEIRG